MGGAGRAVRHQNDTKCAATVSPACMICTSSCSWIPVPSAHSWEGGCLVRTCALFLLWQWKTGAWGCFVACYCFTKGLIKWLKGKGGKMQFWTQTVLTRACSLLRAARLRSAAVSLKPFWIICGCFVVAPLPSPASQALLEVALGCCQQEVVHPQ